MPLPRIGVIGLGYWGKNYLRILGDCSQAILGAIYDRDIKRVEHWQKEYPYAKACTELADVLRCSLDGIIIATPVCSHHRLVRAALEAGIPVLVEKPLAISSREAEELAILADRVRLPLIVDHTYLFAEPVRYLDRCLQAGILGDVYYASSYRLNLGAVRTDCNVLWDLAVHDVALLLYLLKDEPMSVLAHCVSRVKGAPADYATVHLNYHTLASATIQVSWFWPQKVRSLTIVGSRGAAQFDDLDTDKPIRLYLWKPLPVSSALAEDFRPCEYTMEIPELPKREPLRSVVEHFVHCIRGSSTPVSDGWFGVRVLRILEQAQTNIVLPREIHHGERITEKYSAVAMH